MSLGFEDSTTIRLGQFEGDAPPATISSWQSVLPGPIKVYLEPSLGIKNYLYDEFPEGMLVVDFLDSIIAAGITTAEACTLSADNKLISGWQYVEEIGSLVETINQNVG